MPPTDELQYILNKKEHHVAGEQYCFCIGGAAQPAHEADLAVEDSFEAVFAFAANRIKFGSTASAARQLMRGPLGGEIDDT